ncbi:dihydrolipoyl dehydrogenase [Chlamydia suis]|uniref:Dihydrolipoyl dehydrogenase n=1 Tax=Chlamydia suis TaxID=83559 RepID=A0AAQ0J7V1_9CHLA|nr:dihydrolipoyl dehydrogenase [Chlamydia suis]MEB2681376.1 dihydrolipoyl dehydrogenase [Chlamydia suis]MEB2681754.1 dihydrolipoyl dehydrogenase [Chlamydia suis]MEB2682675.1 dihydrolipoyl dehydrogenase [Chlamydia suis]MEB2684083.1 dihydrolipoyl dehydrogenase [Chlamydia suis]MEB2684490.1 dihydrolipoyl dehydrogenase [Chlamydia suis]
MNDAFDCVVIGAGPGGYVAAITAAQAGIKTALIEEREAGGTCLNRGCIPSKALLSAAEIVNQIRHANQFGIHVDNFSIDYPAMVQRKDFVVRSIRDGLNSLIRSNKITVFSGRGSLISSTEVKVLGETSSVIKARSIILATGSEPRAFPGIPFSPSSPRILCSTGVLNLKELPQKLAIIGGGVIGCEFASLFHTLGSKVSVIEASQQILALNNPDISKTMFDKFSRQGLRFMLGASVSDIQDMGDRVRITINGNDEEYDYVLVSIGRRLNTENLGLDKAGVICDERGVIPTDSTMRTNIPNIYAIGDITGQWQLAHVASHQGIVAARNISGHRDEIDYSAVPSVIFTFPEVATVGLSPSVAQQQGIPVKITKFPFRAIGKAVAMGEADGFAAIISHETSQQILGAYVIGPQASSLISEITLAVRNELTLPCIYETIHAHPTLAEIWAESALLAVDTPLHMPPTKK